MGPVKVRDDVVERHSNSRTAALNYLGTIMSEQRLNVRPLDVSSGRLGENCGERLVVLTQQAP